MRRQIFSKVSNWNNYLKKECLFGHRNNFYFRDSALMTLGNNGGVPHPYRKCEGNERFLVLFHWSQSKRGYVICF